LDPFAGDPELVIDRVRVGKLPEATLTDWHIDRAPGPCPAKDKVVKGPMKG